MRSMSWLFKAEAVLRSPPRALPFPRYYFSAIATGESLIFDVHRDELPKEHNGKTDDGLRRRAMNGFGKR